MAKLQYRTISKRTIGTLPVGDKEAVYWDRDLPGFGVRVYPNGTKVYIVQTRVDGKSRRITVDRHGVISPDQARRKAAQMIARIKAGEDPKPETAKKPTGPTVAELAQRYLVEHVEVRCKPRTVEACRWLVKKFVLPDLADMTIAEVRREHITDLHHKHRSTPYQANRILEVVRKMFNLAEAWGLREDGSNPCRHVQKYKENKRERFLTEAEFHRLGQVLNEIEAEGPEHLASVTAIRLLMLTGCRLNEIQTLRWEDVDLEAAELRLRDTKTGARMVPLSNAAVGVLSALPREHDNPWVIAGKKPGAHLTDIQKPWRRIRSRAELDDVRIHDLRHSFASRALALGESLPMIGKLLGHTQVQTTARYAHLANESVKASGSRVGDSIGTHITPFVP
ncbi:MAG: site-specific integrase [Boseongicola sp.]|nr:site-specific integrase [Boseongicola sp.]